MEFEVLKTLEFDLTNPSSYRFLERFHWLFYQTFSRNKCFFLAQYILEITLLDYSLLKWRPSELAAASLVIASQVLNTQQTWSRELERTSGYTLQHLQPVIADVKSFVVEVNPKFLIPLKYKFNKEEYMAVASIDLSNVS